MTSQKKITRSKWLPNMAYKRRHTRLVCVQIECWLVLPTTCMPGCAISSVYHTLAKKCSLQLTSCHTLACDCIMAWQIRPITTLTCYLFSLFLVSYLVSWEFGPGATIVSKLGFDMIVPLSQCCRRYVMRYFYLAYYSRWNKFKFGLATSGCLTATQRV